MKRSTLLIGCSVIAATLAATFQFAGGLGGDAPAAGGSDVPEPTVAATITTESTDTNAPTSTSTTSTTVTSTTVTSPTTVSSTVVSTTVTSSLPADDAVRDVLDLLGGLTVADPDPTRPSYDRDTYQPDGWADLDGDCISGRHEVLITQSATPVRMDSSGCFVETGSWTDPYTGTVVTEARDITIDHVVPLSAADRAGAWRWDPVTKIAFANDETPGVLVAVVGSVNQAKGDKTPDEWLPPREDHHCAYASNWVTTKDRWRLSVIQTEATTLRRILSSCASVDIPAHSTAAPPLIVLAPPVTSTTVGAVVSPVDGAGGSGLQIVQCQRREERVVLVNPTTDAISLAGYELHDEESRHSTMLDRFGSIPPGATLVVLTGEDAVESPGEVIWKMQNVWNNDGDTAYLVAPSGSVTSERC